MDRSTAPHWWLAPVPLGLFLIAVIRSSELLLVPKLRPNSVVTPRNLYSTNPSSTAHTLRKAINMADVPMYVTSEYSSSERRITPSWSIAQLKTKMEPITGIPPSSQRITLKTLTNETIPIEAADEETTYLQNYPLAPYAEFQIIDLRPPSARPNFNPAGVEKYVMPEEEYEKKADSVLAWKKAQKLGRFDPNAPTHEQAKIAAFAREVEERGIEVGKRCRVGEDDTRRGVVKYVGEVKEIPGSIGAWIGVHLDEPVGKNDGRIGETRYWGEESQLKHGVFVRPDRVEVGDFPIVDDLEDMEEI